MRDARGFTLIELLVVIVIIAILAAIVLPILRARKQAALRTSCASNLNQIAKAMYMYSDVQGGGPFPNTATGNDPFAVTGSTLPSLNLLYKGYLQDPRVFSCPTKPIPPAKIKAIEPYVSGTAWPSQKWMVPAQCSYGYDPGHGPNDAAAAIMADRKGNGANSDNHFANVGQNVLIGAGAVEWRDSPVNILDAKGLKDDDIFGLNSNIPRNLDGNVRQ